VPVTLSSPTSVDSCLPNKDSGGLFVNFDRQSEILRQQKFLISAKKVQPFEQYQPLGPWAAQKKGKEEVG